MSIEHPYHPPCTPGSRAATMCRDWTDVDDRDLLLKANDDREAFAEIYRRHAPAILAYLSHAVGQSELAFDLTAETFAAALIALPNYRATAAPGRSWLFAIAHNRLIDSVRRGKAEARAREQLRMQAIALSDEGEALIDAIITRFATRSALELVQDLPDEQRNVINARFVAELDYAEIAAVMECSEQVVRKRVSRGLSTLRMRMIR